MSLLREFESIKKQAFQDQYAIFKKEFLEQVKKNPFNNHYYIAKNISEQSSNMVIKLFLDDGFKSKYIYDQDDNCSWIIINVPNEK